MKQGCETRASILAAAQHPGFCPLQWWSHSIKPSQSANLTQHVQAYPTISRETHPLYVNTRDVRMAGGNRNPFSPKSLVFSLAMCLVGSHLGMNPTFADQDQFPKSSESSTESSNQSSGVQNAIAVVESDGQAGAELVASPPGSIQQVVGKQPGQRTTRGSSQNQSRPVRNFIDGIFGAEEPQPSRAVPVNNNRGSVDWEGIPYHQARSKNTNVGRNQPIRDPRPGEARVLAQGSRPPLKNIQTPTRRESVATNPNIPKPPALSKAPSSRRIASSTPGVSSTPAKSAPTQKVARKEVPRLSSEASSRRGGRRDLPTLDASELAAAAAKSSKQDPEETLVPKVSRRRIGSETPKVAKSQPKVSTPKPAEKKSTSGVPAADVASKTVERSQQAEGSQKTASQNATRAAKPATPKPATAPKTAVAELPRQAPEAAPTPAPTTPRTSPKATLQQPITAPTQIAQAPTSVPLAPAASTVSERTGPPATAFQPQSEFQARRNVEDVPNLPAPGTAQPSAEPIGSGVASNSTDANGVTFRPPAIPPMTSPVNPHAATAPYQQPPAYSPYNPAAQTPYAPTAAPQNRIAQTPVTQTPVTQTPVTQAPAANTLGAHAPETHAGTHAPAPQNYPVDPYAGSRPAPTTPAAPYAAAAQPAPATTTISRPAESRTTDTRSFADRPFAAPPTPQPRPIAETRALEPGKTAVASELPGIRVVTHGPAHVMIRQTHQFEIRVENRGSIDASGVMVRAIIPDWAEVRGQNASRGNVEAQSTQDTERLVWTIDSLPAGTSEVLNVRLKAERSGTHGLDVDWTLIPQKSIATIEVREPQLSLEIEGPDSVVYGESQSYKVRVLNPGDGIAPNVVFTLSPNSPTPQTQRIGDIPSGKEAQFEVELTAQDLGDLKIHGLATGDLELRSEASKTIRVSAAKLSALMNGPELKYQDTEAVYNLQIQNEGDATSKNIVARLNLPLGAQYLGGIEGAQQRGSMLTWQIDALAPTATRDYEFRCMMNAPGDQTFAFDCKGTAAGETKVALDTRVEAIADLVLSIQDPSAPAPVGSEVTYEILIRNRGSKDATGVRAIAQFSHGIEPRRVEGHSGEVLTGQVLFDSIPAIKAGGELRLKVIAEAAQGGHHRFRTEVRSGETVLVAEEATHYMSRNSERVSRRSTGTTIK